eukprot:353722-Pleurochrysis_carterae.AAC.2
MFMLASHWQPVYHHPIRTPWSPSLSQEWLRIDSSDTALEYIVKTVYKNAQVALKTPTPTYPTVKHYLITKGRQRRVQSRRSCSGSVERQNNQFFRAGIHAPPFLLQAKLGSKYILQPLHLPVHLVTAEEEELQADAEKGTNAEDPKTGINEEEPVAQNCLVHDEDGAPRDKNTGVSSAIMLLDWLRESKGIALAQAVRVHLERAHA